MPAPFPGMDPFLEHPDVFPDLHDTMITFIKVTLQEKLPRPYFASLASRVWVEVSRRFVQPDVKVMRPRGGRRGRRPKGTVAVAEHAEPAPVVVTVPQEEYREPRVEIYARNDRGKRLVTALEILSTANKTPGEQGRALYLQKQRELLESKTNLVEIDLLRGGQHTTAVPRALATAQAGDFDYHVCVHRFDRPCDYLLYAMVLADLLPRIAVPLLPEDPPVTIDLQGIFTQCYDAGEYPLVDYTHAALQPPLPAAQAAWVRKVLQAKGIHWNPRNGKRK